MKKFFTLLLLLPIALAGCASSNLDRTPTASVADTNPGEVVIYRNTNVQAGLARAYIGTDEGYFVQLEQNQYTRFEIDPGFHQFKVRAHGSVSSQRDINVNPGETLCIEARPNYEDAEWLIVPFVNALLPSFVLEETRCPSLDNYSSAKA